MQTYSFDPSLPYYPSILSIFTFDRFLGNKIYIRRTRVIEILFFSSFRSLSFREPQVFMVTLTGTIFDASFSHMTSTANVR